MTLEERLEKYLGARPSVGAAAFVASSATVCGDVRLGRGSSVWYQAVLRGDINYIEVGDETNIQDGAVLHLSEERPCLVGVRVTVGHGAILHACSIGDECLIGMGAVVLDGAVIGKGCIVGARALVTQNTVVPDGCMVLGMPGKVIRPINAEEFSRIKLSAEKYVQTAIAHRKKQAV